MHAVVYVVDAARLGAADGDAAAAERALFEADFGAAGKNAAKIAGKPLLIVANKQDGAAAPPAEPEDGEAPAEPAPAAEAGAPPPASAAAVAAALGVELGDDARAVAGSAHPRCHGGAGGELDAPLAEGLEWLFERVLARHDELAARVAADLAARDELAREKKRLKDANTFCITLRRAFALGDYEGEDEATREVYAEQDALEFFASECGLTPALEGAGTNVAEDFAHEEVAKAARAGAAALPEAARELVRLVGRQKVAMKMMGGMFTPIKKDVAKKDWPEIKAYVLERRAEVGIALDA